MLYKSFYVKISPCENIIREDKNGEKIKCLGFQIQVFSDKTEQLKLDQFSVAVDFEILKNDISEAEQFAKNYVDCEEKEYHRMIDEWMWENV